MSRRVPAPLPGCVRPARRLRERTLILPHELERRGDLELPSRSRSAREPHPHSGDRPVRIVRGRVRGWRNRPPYMSTVIGHTLASVAVYEAFRRRTCSRMPQSRRWYILPILVAPLADLDSFAPSAFSLHYLFHHRGATHSLFGAIALGVGIALACRVFSRSVRLVPLATALTLCALTHPLLDYLTASGPPVQWLWPLTVRGWLSPVSLIPGAFVPHRPSEVLPGLFGSAALFELLVFLPILLAVRMRSRSRSLLVLALPLVLLGHSYSSSHLGPLESFEEYYAGGGIKKKGRHDSRLGHEYGEFVTWHENANRASKGNYYRGHLHGELTRWFENGVKQSEERLRTGLLHGRFTRWNERGTKLQEGTYWQSAIHGTLRMWRENGTLWTETAFVLGVPHGPTTAWHENGQVSMRGNSRFGHVHGGVSWWDRDGRLLATSDFHRGTGVFRDFYEDGQPRKLAPYKSGEPHGDWVWWSAEGEVLARSRFENGNGTMHVFDDSGRLVLVE